jgi:translation elongation factor EF-1beta
MSDWSISVETQVDKDTYRKIEKAQVQQQEVAFHLQRLNRMMQLYIDSGDCKTTEIKQSLLVALERVKEFSL